MITNHLVKGRLAMNVALAPEQEKFILEEVSSGKYSSPNEVVRAGLSLLMAREDQLRFEEFRKEIALGVDEANRGELIDGEEVFKKLRAQIQTVTGNDQ